MHITELQNFWILPLKKTCYSSLWILRERKRKREGLLTFYQPLTENKTYSKYSKLDIVENIPAQELIKDCTVNHYSETSFYARSIFISKIIFVSTRISLKHYSIVQAHFKFHVRLFVTDTVPQRNTTINSPNPRTEINNVRTFISHFRQRLNRGLQGLQRCIAGEGHPIAGQRATQLSQAPPDLFFFGLSWGWSAAIKATEGKNPVRSRKRTERKNARKEKKRRLEKQFMNS